MMQSPMALDLAHLLIHERLQHSAREARLKQFLAARPRAQAASPAVSLLAALLVGRHRLAAGLRNLAVRLDPPLAILKAR